MDWENFGDIDFARFGGCLCKDHLDAVPADSADVVDVLYYDPEAGGDGQVMAFISTVDIREIGPQALHDILYACGLEDKMAHVDEDTRVAVLKELGHRFVAKEAVESGMAPASTRGPGDGADDTLVGIDEFKSWMASVGAGGYA